MIEFVEEWKHAECKDHANDQEYFIALHRLLALGLEQALNLG